MNTRIKPITSLITLALFTLAALGDANASSERSKRHTSEQIQACISRIARHADYDNASRVVHWIDTAKQRSLVEMEIKIATSVYLSNDNAVTREYMAFCVVGTMGDLIKFRIDAVGSDREMDGK